MHFFCQAEVLKHFSHRELEMLLSEIGEDWQTMNMWRYPDYQCPIFKYIISVSLYSETCCLLYTSNPYHVSHCMNIVNPKDKVIELLLFQKFSSNLVIAVLSCAQVHGHHDDYLC